MHVLQIYSHSPESCPIGNPKNLQIMMDWLKKVDTIAAKHGLRVVGIWTDRWGHTSWATYETPTIEAFAKLSLEPDFMKRVTFNHIETRVVTSAKETLSFFANYKKESR